MNDQINLDKISKINKLLDAMKEKGIPFSYFIGDLPTYKLKFELQTENPDKFLNTVPTIGAFI